MLPDGLPRFDPTASGLAPATQDKQPMMQHQPDQFGIHLTQDAPRLRAAPLVQVALALPMLKQQLNGLIANDKFCFSRTTRLHLAHWRLALRHRPPQIGYPAENPSPSGGSHDPFLDAAPAGDRDPGGAGSVGSSLPLA